MDVGLELRTAREQRGLSIRQISNITKISPRMVQAIEASDESRLPATVFTRSFVKTYAALLGLDPAETARRYVDQFEPPPAAGVTETGHESNSDTSSQAEAPVQRIARVLQGRFGTAAVLLLAGVILLGLLVRNYRHVNDVRTPSAAAPAVSAVSVSSASTRGPAPVGTSGAGQEIGALHLSIAPTGPCWVQATVAGQPVLAQLLAAGDRREVDTASDVILRIGDPAAFAFAINGKPARISGAKGHAVTVHVTKDNYSTFLTR